MTLSPGFVTAIIAAIIASVLPQVTTISLSGSTFMPEKCSCFAASASLKFCAPQVKAYWCGPSAATSARRSVISFGGSKSGNPWERFTAPYFNEILVILRITESVNPALLLLNSFIFFCSSCSPNIIRNMTV